LKHLGIFNNEIKHFVFFRKKYSFRVRHSLKPSAFQCIFSYLEDPGLIRDKYGRDNKSIFFEKYVSFFSIGLWTLMTAVGRKCFGIYVDEMKKMVK
jgi:hypothetical protein